MSQNDESKEEIFYDCCSEIAATNCRESFQSATNTELCSESVLDSRSRSNSGSNSGSSSGSRPASESATSSHSHVYKQSDNDETTTINVDNETSNVSSIYFIDEDFKKNCEEKVDNYDFEKMENDAVELKAEGNGEFQRKNFENAAKIYTQALVTCPVTKCQNLRAILYSNRAAAFVQLHLLDEAILDCSKALEFDTNFLKALHRRAEIYKLQDHLDKALEDFKLLLEKNPSNSAAKFEILKLTPIVQERQEKLKAEMIDKLKDLGNLILRPFGLSTNNFKLQPNESGGYSVQMQR